MARAWYGRWSLFGGALFLVLAGCQEGAGPFSGERETRPLVEQGGGRTLGERDMENPEAFSRNETGLWDGRPSLGGIWVAHPDVTTPERVLIQNTENGKQVVGALFRRERENPGPRFQISSDAAAELGILAGQPTDLRVVALARREVEVPAPAEAAPADAQEDLGADAITALGATDAAAGADVAEPQPVPEDRPPTSLGRRRAPPADPAPVALPADAAETLPGTDPALAAHDADLQRAEPQPVPEDRPPSSLARRPRAPASPAPAGLATEEVSVMPLDGMTPPEAAPVPEAASSLRQPYLQAASFSTEANANAAAEQLRAAGLTARVGEQTGGASSIWRVVVGPAATEAERNELREKLSGLGYRDAFPVSN